LSRGRFAALRLDGKFRAECLNQHWFMSLDDAVRKCAA
jgi:putative transposase